MALLIQGHSVYYLHFIFLFQCLRHTYIFGTSRQIFHYVSLTVTIHEYRNSLRLDVTMTAEKLQQN